MILRSIPGRQRGMTIMSLLIVIIVVSFFVVTGMKIYPGYYENFKAKKALNSLVDEVGIGKAPKATIWRMLERRFDIDMVNGIKKEYLFITFDKETKKRKIALTYEYRTPLYGNITAALAFDDYILVDPQ
ncbi:MAG: DUF4845 domain-containing protein [Gammaproteobacteria bacterium]|nr:DUF4845 domain-containing protein [Gammaproteobacteria bacterium]